jgi:hypothetical protein
VIELAETQKDRIIRVLGVTEAEANEILACDKKIEQGKERMDFDLDPETEKMAKKFANVTTKKKPLVLENKPRPRKENPTKASIISELAKFLEADSENACVNVEITNKERQIAFAIGDQKYELTLVAKRPPKK